MVALAREAGHEVPWYEPRLGLGGLGGRTSGRWLGRSQRRRAAGRRRPVLGADPVADRHVTAPAAGDARRRRHRHAGVRPAVGRRRAADPVAPSVPARVAPAAAHHAPGTSSPAPPGAGCSTAALRIFTAMPVELPGVEVVPNAYAWVAVALPGARGQRRRGSGRHLAGGDRRGPAGALPRGRAVAGRAVRRRPLLRPPQGGRARSWPGSPALGVAVERPDLPLELVARRGPVGRTVLSFPSTVRAHPAAGAGRHRRRGAGLRIATDWYRPGAPDRADDFLDRVTSTARAQHGLATVAC